MNLVDALLPVLQKVAAGLAATPFGEQALADVRDAEQIAARHAQALEAELTAWLTARLHPQAPPPAA